MSKVHSIHLSTVLFVIVSGKGEAVWGAEGRISLSQAVAASLQNPVMLAAREAIAQARAELLSATVLPNPTLGIEAGLLPLSRRYTAQDPGGPSELAFALSYPVDGLLFGKRRAAAASAEIAIRLAETQVADEARLRVLETTLAFYAVLEADALRAIAVQAVQDVQRSVSAIERAVSSGGRPQVELGRMRLELHSAKREERAAELALVTAKTGLRALMGMGAESPIEVENVLDAPLTQGPSPREQAFVAASTARPDIQAVRLQVEKAHRDEVLERRNAWPETSLGLGIARQFQQAIGASDVTAWGATLEVALPLFDRKQGPRSRAASLARQAELELSAALVELHAEVDEAVQTLDLALVNANEIARTDLELATKLRDSVQMSYNAGGRSLLEMLDALRGYREISRAYVSSRAAYWRALARYQSALGK
jgi:cobalt-zinc-cadmium efflux system outer membrane protein